MSFFFVLHAMPAQRATQTHQQNPLSTRSEAPHSRSRYFGSQKITEIAGTLLSCKSMRRDAASESFDVNFLFCLDRLVHYCSPVYGRMSDVPCFAQVISKTEGMSSSLMV